MTFIWYGANMFGLAKPFGSLVIAISLLALFVVIVLYWLGTPVSDFPSQIDDALIPLMIWSTNNLFQPLTLM